MQPAVFGGGGSHLFALVVQQLGGCHRCPRVKCAGHLHRRFLIVFGQRSGDHRIGNVLFLPQQQVHIAENAGHPEFVLVFKIAAVAPFHHQHRQHIVAGFDKFGHIKFIRRMGHLAVSDKVTVHPYIVGGVHPLKAEVYPTFGLHPQQLERAQIRAAGVVHRHIRRVVGKRILDVHILVVVVAVHLPHRRHRQSGKADGGVGRLKKWHVHAAHTVEIAELPPAVQRNKAVGAVAPPGASVPRGHIGDEIGARGQRAPVQYLHVFKKIVYQHHGSSLQVEDTYTPLVYQMFRQKDSLFGTKK